MLIDGAEVYGRYSFGVIPERGGVNAGWGDADRRVVLDFNRATNLPCAYRDHAVAPGITSLAFLTPGNFADDGPARGQSRSGRAPSATA